MAETPDSASAVAEPGQPDAPATGRFSILGKLKILLLLAVVIVVECLAAYWYLPSAAQTAALAGATVPPPANKAAKGTDTKSADDNETPEQAEVDLGEFCVTAFQATSNSTLRIDFHLFGTIKAENQKEFAKLLEESKHRLREQILVTVRAAEVTDLTDAGLGLMKRKILDRANHTLGKPLLQSVVVSDFSFVEQ
jgi:flagellar FliL protein